MRSAVVAVRGLFVLVPLLTALAAVALAEERVVMSYPLIGPAPSHRIVSVDRAKREARIEASEASIFSIPAEGNAVLVVASKKGGPLDTLVRVNVGEILDGNVAVVTFGPGAEAAVTEGPAVLGRPFAGLISDRFADTASTKSIRGLPDLLVVRETATGVVNQLVTARDAARRVASQNHLKQLALAFHNYHDAHGCFPPAAVIGPDGRKWHSWRVLLLPYLEQADLYNQYDFSQPWDSPKNKALAEKVVAVFRDPAREGPPDGFTDYAAIVGQEAIFRPGVATMKSADDFPACLDSGKKIGLATVTDGTSNTIMFATVDPARKIPWTKPEDIVFDEDFPGIGKPTGIGAIHPIGDGHCAAVVSFADGSVQTLADSVDTEIVRKLLTRGGGEVVDRDDLGGSGAGAADPNRPPLLKVVADDDGKLRLEID